MIVGILENETKTGDKQIALSYAKLLKEHGFESIIFSFEQKLEGMDVLLVLGGDGTILRSVALLENKNTPIIGVNYGKIGFLTEFEKNEENALIQLLEDFRSNSAEILHRSTLQVEFNGKKYYALNEITIQRDYTPVQSKILEITININDVESDVFTGDGLIVCTPTGSTAYSLSAGGAILDPRTHVFMLTAICAFSLNVRPVVVPETDKISLSIAHSDALLLVDGKTVANLKPGDFVEIEKSPYIIDFPKRKDSHFLSKIAKKLK